MAFWAKIQSTLARAWVERDNRLRVADPEKITFHIKDESLEIKKLRVQNISTGGVGLLPSEFPNAGLGRNIEAEIRISGGSHGDSQKSSTFKINATIVHVAESTIGLRFTQVSSAFEAALDQYFKAELIGTQLKIVDKRYLKAEGDILPLWLTDGRDNEIYILADNAVILGFHLCFMGHYIEGDKTGGVRVGQMTATTHEDTIRGYSESEVIEMTPRVQQISLRLARDFVSNAKGVPPELMKALISRLTIS